MTDGHRTVAPPASPASPAQLLGPCASCGRPLVRFGPATWHARTGTVACDALRDPADGGWCEPETVTLRLLPGDARALAVVVTGLLAGSLDGPSTSALVSVGAQLAQERNR
jgi:hypothetical protein